MTASPARRRRKPATPKTPARRLVPLGVADGRESYREASDEEILAAARVLLARRVRRGITFTSPRVVREYLLHTYSPLDYEIFVMVALDNRHRLIAVTELFRGTVDGVSSPPGGRQGGSSAPGSRGRLRTSAPFGSSRAVAIR